MLNRTIRIASLLLVVGALSLTGCKKKQVKDDALPTDDVTTVEESDDSKASTEAADSELRDAMLALRRVHFGFDSAELTDASRQALSEAAPKLASRTEVHLYVEGHADSAGETEYNMTLGEKRAKAVAGYLEKLGVAGDRLHVVSYGEEMPLKDGATRDALAANRRVDFKLMRGDVELVVEESAVID